MSEITLNERVAAEGIAAAGGIVWPRITVVTAVYNGAGYLEETIRSVIGQGYPNLEYIVVDGESTDGTVEIIKKYEKDLAWWVSKKDKNVYEALQTGFSRATGEVMGWLNSSDKLHTHGLFVVGSVFAQFPQVEWITGRPTSFSESGMPVLIQALPRWSRYRFLAGANKYIQQESTYWRRGLWERAGGAMSTEDRAAGDFELWVRFFRYTQIYAVDALIAGYRFHADAMSFAGREKYDQACEEIVERELNTIARGKAIRRFRGMGRVIRSLPKGRGLWQHVVLKSLYKLGGADLPPMIEDRQNKWVMRAR
ncbi:MAG TPA: glycosyltransferase family 2 protein [Candidatus Acidoferrum sp.]|jgi:glycosyltransferase involved in cell wall biosynthesis